MKKIFLILCLILCIYDINAQTILGGSLGIGGKIEKLNNEQINNTLKLSFAPRVGYQIVNKVEVGCALELVYCYESKYKMNEIDLLATPYVRYYFIEKGHISIGILTQASLGGTVYTNRTIIYQDMSEINISNNNYKNFKYNFYIIPSIQIKTSEHLFTEIDFNAIGIGINGVKQTYMVGNNVQNVYHIFNWGLHLFTNSDYLKIGTIYKF